MLTAALALTLAAGTATAHAMHSNADAEHDPQVGHHMMMTNGMKM